MGVRVEVQMTGGGFGAAAQAIEAALVQGMNRAAERLLALSAEQVPLDVGTLSSSGTVVPATGIDNPAAVVYDTPYAARLHEHPEFTFQGGRKGKYVEDPAVQNRKELGDIIRKEVRGNG